MNSKIINDFSDKEGDEEEQKRSIGIIKKIVDKKKKMGVIYYKVEWKDEHPTSWEPLSNFINCGPLLKDFDLKKKNNKDKDLFELSEEGNLQYDIPICILGISEIEEKNDIYFLVQWKERFSGYQPKNSICSRRDLKKKYPLLLIHYYESHLIL